MANRPSKNGAGLALEVQGYVELGHKGSCWGQRRRVFEAYVLWEQQKIQEKVASASMASGASGPGRNPAQGRSSVVARGSTRAAAPPGATGASAASRTSHPGRAGTERRWDVGGERASARGAIGSCVGVKGGDGRASRGELAFCATLLGQHIRHDFGPLPRVWPPDKARLPFDAWNQSLGVVLCGSHRFARNGLF